MYNATTIFKALSAAAFKNVIAVPWRDSEYEHLLNLECRPFHENLIFEGAK